MSHATVEIKKQNKLDREKYTARIAKYLGVDNNNLYPYIITRESSNPVIYNRSSGKRVVKDDDEATLANGFIRWDVLCHLFNTHFIPKNEKDGLPSFVLTCTQLINEDLPINESEVRAGKHMSPILMAKVNNPLADKIISGQTTALDNSLDPTVCLAPHQDMEALGDPRSSQLQPQFAKYGIIPNTGDEKLGEELEKMTHYNLTDHEKKYYIGHMLLNVNRLQQTYKSMKYDEDGAIKKDFYMYDFIKKIWDDVSDAGGNNHDFKITTDFERPNIVRVVDMRYQENANLKSEDIIELNIQSNDSIVRDFSFNTSIPSAMSATIAIVAQAPRNVDSLEAASFGAFHQNISNRFATFIDPSEPTGPTEEDKDVWRNAFDEDFKTYQMGLNDLATHMDSIMAGDFMVAAEGGDAKKSEEVGKYKGLVSAVRRASENLIKMAPETNEAKNIYKGQPLPFPPTSATSAIIPLKFNATLDGISGMVIGNVFKLPDSRLPRGYKNANIAFVIMTEDQTISSGQDWVTKITGQMIMLPKKGKVGDVIEGGWDNIDFNQFDEEADTTKQYNEGESISLAQSTIDKGMNKVKINSKVYLKTSEYTHVRSAAIIDNESAGDWDDNIIGLFSAENEGLYLGTVIDTTSAATFVRVDGIVDEELRKEELKELEEAERITGAFLGVEDYKFPDEKRAAAFTSTEDKWYRALADGSADLTKEVSKSDINNEGWPWYKIRFGENAQKHFIKGYRMRNNGNLDANGADHGYKWDTSKTGWMRLDVLMASNEGTQYGPGGKFKYYDISTFKWISGNDGEIDR